MIKLEITSIAILFFLFSSKLLFSQDLPVNGNIKFGSEYNNIIWPANPSYPYGGGITGDDRVYKRLTLYHGHSIAFETGSNQLNYSYTRMYINSIGYVGIGTTSPSSKFDMYGNKGVMNKIHISDVAVGSDGGYFDINMGSTNDYAGGIRAYVPDGQPGIDRVYLGLYTTTYDGILKSRVERLTVTDRGNVGIGTASPDAKLTVKGTIHSEEVKVEVVNGPDFVFNEDYNLKSLKEIETYIKQNHHLPEVPSAAEMQANGVELGKMNMLLLQKIEELTLLMIQLKKTNDLEMNSLRKEIEILKNR